MVFFEHSHVFFFYFAFKVFHEILLKISHTNPNVVHLFEFGCWSRVLMCVNRSFVAKLCPRLDFQINPKTRKIHKLHIEWEKLNERKLSNIIAWVRLNVTFTKLTLIHRYALKCKKRKRPSQNSLFICLSHGEMNKMALLVPVMPNIKFVRLKM